MTDPSQFDMFVSYSSIDRDRVAAVVSGLRAAGVSVWFDQDRIEGGHIWAAEIVHAIRGCQLLVLMCSDASMRSWAVKQEILVAGQNEKPILPVLLEPTRFPAQVEFFLAGRHWVEVGGGPPEGCVAAILRALDGTETSNAAGPLPTLPARPGWGLETLRSLARFTDQLLPVAAQPFAHSPDLASRGLGALPEAVRHTFALGDRLQIMLELDQPGHILLLDEGPEGIIYCLCPSEFAPVTSLPQGRTIFPLPGSPHDAFYLSGRPGVEHLLAIVSDTPLMPGWGAGRNLPARVLSAADIRELLDSLTARPPGSWTALATSFRVQM